jgi:hypothetical protein
LHLAFVLTNPLGSPACLRVTAGCQLTNFSSGVTMTTYFTDGFGEVLRRVRVLAEAGELINTSPQRRMGRQPPEPALDHSRWMMQEAHNA